MVAPNTAVVTGQSHEAGKDKSGQAFDRSFVYTDTFVNRNGKWVVVATHASKK
jgi:ketosteroid isomerase-like protein